jgi:3-deoxy-manno-octulosonate cytidylyltransferase (CMP-KDO synthetase)
VFVATDDERIAQCVRTSVARATGPDHPGTDRLRSCLTQGSSGGGSGVNIQGDQPIFEHPCILDLIRPLQEDTGSAYDTLVFKMTDDHEVKDLKNAEDCLGSGGFALFSRSPIPYYRDSGSERIYYKHLGFYAYRKGF